MRKIGQKILPIFIALAMLAAGVFYFQKPLYQDWKFASLYWSKYFVPPCQKPIDYSLGAMDKKFNISQADLLAALKQASEIWSSAAGKQLFAYSATGELKINLIYDYRQATTDKLKTLGIAIGNDQSSYDALKIKYDALYKQYNQQKAALQSLTNSFNQQQNALNDEIKSWNDRGGAPPAEYKKLNQERAAINSLVSQINTQTASVNALADDLNAEATALNKLISELNLDAKTYNGVGTQLGKEFIEGNYTQDINGTAINIYEFNTRQRLIRLLAHEMGHALGLPHSSNPIDIMYELNSGDSTKLSANDVVALKKECQLK